MIAHSALTLPPARRRRLLPATVFVFAAFALMAGAYLGSGGRVLSLFAPSGPAPRSPHLAIELSSQTHTVGSFVGGKVTITAADAASVSSPIEIDIYPGGVAQTESARLRTIRVSAPVSALAPGEMTAVPFSWDQRDGTGQLVATGIYAITVRASSQVDIGNSHAGTTGIAQVNVRITQ